MKTITEKPNHMIADNDNPCLKCGACCAYFRVSFHWMETQKESFNVPPSKIETLDNHKVCFKGTNQKNPRCICLKGKIGKKVHCGNYKRRASVCREFPYYYEFPEDLNERCNKARIAHGLTPLEYTKETED